MQMQSQQSQATSFSLRGVEPDMPLPEALLGALEGAATRQGFGLDAAQALWRAMALGQGVRGQFDHPEFGGPGQWMRGGMLIIGDMFNAALLGRVAALCEDLSRLYDAHPEWHAARAPRCGPAATEWWPEGLHSPASSGAQNGIGYAFFPGQRRLAIRRDGRVELYDTGDHLIGAVSQQQDRATSLSFASQRGPVSLGDLLRVDTPANAPAPAHATRPPEALAAEPAANLAVLPRNELLDTIEKLAALHERGVITEAEFVAKKTELLGRL